VSTREELRTADEVAIWVAAGLRVRRVADRRHDDSLVDLAILACASELETLPPAGVIADLAGLVAGAELAGAASSGDAALLGALRTYEDDVLVRLLSSPRFEDARAAFAHVELAARPTAVALLVGALCRRASFVGTSVSPAMLRRALARSPDERAASGQLAIQGGAVAAALAGSYLRLARGARQSRALVEERDVFAIDHLAVLGSYARRLAADHIGAAASAIAATLPRRVPSRRARQGQRDTNLDDDTLYPAGGFAAISPSASTSFENLVSSELVYMEGGADAVDLFTLRHVEGELLYYTRDDSVLRRHHHTIVVALDADLERARVKDPELPWQRLVLGLGLVVATVRWLVERLGDRALTIQLAFPAGALIGERELVELLLEGELRGGTVHVAELDWSAACRVCVQAGGMSDLLAISSGDLPPVPRGVRARHLRLDHGAPVLAAPEGDELADSPADDEDRWTAWCECTEELLRWLV
jgi:hypothetical protein